MAKKTGKKKKVGVYRCTECGTTNYVIKIKETTPKICAKYCSRDRKRIEHKLYDKTK